MKRLFTWLETKFSRLRTFVAADQPREPLTPDPDRIDAPGSGTNDLMPDIYADADADTQPYLQILEPSSPDVDESAGFDPYDTGVRQKK